MAKLLIAAQDLATGVLISRVENDSAVGASSVTHIDVAIARGRG